MEILADTLSGLVIFATLAFAAGAVGMLFAESPAFKSLKEVAVSLRQRFSKQGNPRA